MVMDQTLPSISTTDLAAAVAPLAHRYKRANGPVIRLVNRLGSSLESQLSALPDVIPRPDRAADRPGA